MTTITAALVRSSLLLNPGPFRRGFLIGFFSALAAGVALLAALSIAVGAGAAGKMMPGVHVGGISLAGMDRAAAEAKLIAELPSLRTGELLLVVDGTSVDVPYAELGRGYRIDEMLDAAYSTARSGNLFADSLARLRVLAVPTDITPIISSEDTEALHATVMELVARFSREPVDASVTLRGGSFSVTPGADGAGLDPDALEAALRSAMTRTDAGADSVTMSTTAVHPAVTTSAAERAAAEAERMIAMPLTLRTDASSHVLDEAQLASLVTFGERSGSFAAVVDREALAALIEPMAPEVAREPRNAGFEWDANGVAAVTPALDGLELDVQRSVSAVVGTLRSRAGAAIRRSVALAVVATPPALTTAAAQAAAAEMQPLASWTTYYAPGEGNFWGANISIPARDLDRLVLAPGEWFSFWDDIGPVTLERGYGYGGVILGGRSVANGALAGGICSTSTTLFNAAMRAGLEIGERRNHSYYIERYPVGLDATVFQSDTYEVDMTFRNDTEHPVVIRSYTGTGFVRFDIWGVPDGRTVTLSTPVTSNHGVARETTVVNESLKPGTSIRREYPHNGFDAVVTRTVRDADGEVIWVNTWSSHYKTINGITEVGPTPKPKPEPTDPPPSDEGGTA